MEMNVRYCPVIRRRPAKLFETNPIEFSFALMLPDAFSLDPPNV
jgi:hypothetical protein